MLLDSCQELADKKVGGKNYPEVNEILGFKVKLRIIYFIKLKNNKIEVARILRSKMDLKNKTLE